MNYLKYNKLLVPVLISLLSACAAIPPDSSTIVQSDFAGAQLASGIKLAHDGWPQASWWLLYQDPQLNRLIDHALQNSPTMAVAGARRKSAQAALAGQQAAEGISINANIQANRARYSANGLFPPPIAGSWITEQKVGLNAQYDFDFWGKHRSAIAAAVGEINAAKADRAQAEQNLACAIAQTYYHLQTTLARLQLSQQLHQQQLALQSLRKQRTDAGLDAISPQQISRIDLGGIARNVGAFQTQIKLDHAALQALVGASSTEIGLLKAIALPNTINQAPSRLGLQLLARRPDLQAARWRVEANLSRVESVKAAFYPTIEISANLGLNSIKPGDLLRWESYAAALIPSISLPIFDSGRLDAQLASQRAVRDVAIADYNLALVNAVRDVSQKMSLAQGLQQQTTAQQQAEQGAQSQLSTAQSRLKTGIVDGSATIQAQLQLLNQRDISLQLKQAQIDNEIALIATLGGGYQAPVNN